MAREESEEDVKARMIRDAQPASSDTEDELLWLERLQAKRRKDPAVEREYERLRDSLAARLEKEGPRYYIDNEGIKRYAYAVVPEPVEVDVDLLIEAELEREITYETLDAVAPRKVDKEAFRRAVAAERIPKKVLVKVATVTRGTAYVKTATPDDE